MNDLTLELRSAFLLFDDLRAGQIHISAINRILSSINNLSAKATKPDTLDHLAATNELDKPSTAEFEKRRNSILKQIKLRIEKKSPTPKFSARRSKPNTKVDLIDELNTTGETIVLENPDPALKAFPNGKTSIGFREFTSFFKNVTIQPKIAEELLLQCFRIFDYDE